LASRGASVAVAESMSGGLRGGRLTSTPGSSKVVKGGVIVYTVEAKKTLLGISDELLREHGPVSKEAAVALAEAVRLKLGSTYGISIVGNAGPTPDVDGKPVGQVYIALSTPSETRIEDVKYRGLREDIIRRSTQLALSMLRSELL